MGKMKEFLKNTLSNEKRNWRLYRIGILFTAGVGTCFAVAEPFFLLDIDGNKRYVAQAVSLICLFILSGIALIFLNVLKEINCVLRQMQRPMQIRLWTEIKPGGSRLGNELYEMLDGYREASDKNHAVELLAKQAELDALQSQINPHFLYNTLESIRGRALVENCEVVAEMAEALSALFRYSISRKGDLVTLEEELCNLDNYFLIQRHRFHNKFEVHYIIEDSVLLSALLPRMSIQPLVENAIYHGLETKVGGGLVFVEITEYQRRIEIAIKDNGSGITDERLRQLNLWLAQGRMPKEMGEEQIGIALLNVNKRIALYFGEMYGLRVYSTLGYGTDVRLAIPKGVKETGEA